MTNSRDELIQPTDVGDFGGIRSVEGAATHACHGVKAHGHPFT